MSPIEATAVIAVLSGVIAYLIYRRKTLSFWAVIAAFLPDLPAILLPPFGIGNLDALLLFSHTAGIALWPLLLIIADILLIELSLLRYVEPVGPWLYPKSLRLAVRIEKVVTRLQHYYALPRPVRIRRLYVVGVIAGLFQLAAYIVFGIF